MTTRILLVPAAVLLLTGCARTGKSTRVDELQLARLPPNALGEVNRMRLEVALANDDVARAELELRDSSRRLEVARSERGIALAQRETALKRIDAALQSRDEQSLRLGKEELADATERGRVSDQHLDAVRAQVDAAQAKKTFEESGRDLARARLDEAKYHALRDARDPAAAGYRQTAFDRETEKLERQIADAERDATRSEQKAQELQRVWIESRERYQARTGRPSTG